MASRVGLGSSLQLEEIKKKENMQRIIIDIVFRIINNLSK